MLYAIAGGGEAPATEINKALTDLKNRATKDDGDFWFVLEARDQPSKTDDTILKWLAKNETYFETYSRTDAAYEGAQESHHSDDPYGSMLERVMEVRPDEDSMVLALLPPEEAEDDEELMSLIEGANQAEIEVRQLNGAMATLTLGDAEAEPEPEPAPAPTKKAAAKKAVAPAPAKRASKRAAAASAPPAEEEEVPEGVYTQEELTKLGVPELTGIAKGQGIDTKGLGKRDLITAILGSTRVQEAEEAEATATAAVGNAEAPDDGTVLVLVVTKGAVVQRLLTMEEVRPLLQ